jgi:hypothetical protein
LVPLITCQLQSACPFFAHWRAHFVVVVVVVVLPIEIEISES